MEIRCGHETGLIETDSSLRVSINFEPLGQREKFPFSSDMSIEADQGSFWGGLNFLSCSYSVLLWGVTKI